MDRSSDSLLKVSDLSIEYTSGRNSRVALDGVSCELRRGEVVGLLGESGSGKTTLALAILRLLPRSARILRGSIRFKDQDLFSLPESELRRIRGGKISIIFQEPGLALNPVMRAIDQVAEVVRAHQKVSKDLCKEEARRVLGELDLRDDRLLRAYPHELSGGQRQRLVIAQALAAQPDLIVADEPTAALDPELRTQFRDLLNSLRQRFSLALLFITHDPEELMNLADRAMVLYRGRIVEQAGLRQLIREPAHPFTRLLLRAMPPSPGTARAGTRKLYGG